jgi:hypothetical protein
MKNNEGSAIAAALPASAQRAGGVEFDFAAAKAWGSTLRRSQEGVYSIEQPPTKPLPGSDSVEIGARPDKANDVDDLKVTPLQEAPDRIVVEQLHRPRHGLFHLQTTTGIPVVARRVFRRDLANADAGGSSSMKPRGRIRKGFRSPLEPREGSALRHFTTVQREVTHAWQH